MNTQYPPDYGKMGAEFDSHGQVTFTPCRLDGTPYVGVPVAESSPPEPENGDMWMDSSSDTHVLKQYSASTGMWTDIPAVYVKITMSNIDGTGLNKAFSKYDGVTLSGAAVAEEANVPVSVRDQIAALNGDVIIQDVGDGYIIVTGILDQEITQTVGQVKISRKIPRMQYVCESGNRLWGCYYGMLNGVMVNQIFASKLGDFKNWNCFMGIASDSYAVSVGTDGDFTGAITYLGYPTFFKENCVHKVYGNMPSAYQVQTTQCRGVQKGSEKSLAILNEVLYYKSLTDICAYDGSLPTGISEQLGGVAYKNACAGTGNGRYMVSMQDMQNAWHLFTYDSQRGIWHREDDTHAIQFTAQGQELYYIDATKNAIMTAFGTEGTPEDAVAWRAESGMIGYEMPDRKYVSRFNLRMKLEKGASVNLALEYDSSGIWEDQGTIAGKGMNAFVFPVIPRRCDHFRVKLSGKGGVRIYSIAKIIEQGSDM